jgi:hypothetical protein
LIDVKAPCPSRRKPWNVPVASREKPTIRPLSSMS